MSGVVDLPLVILQKAQHAAEAAAASAKLLETEAGHRLNAIELRLGGVEGRLSGLYAGQNAHTLSLMRISDTQSDHTVALAEHTARFDAIDRRFDENDRRFDAIDKRFDANDRRFDAIDKRFDAMASGMSQALVLLERMASKIEPQN